MTPSNFNPAIAPSGLIVERHEIGADSVIVHARGTSAAIRCPACASPSSSVHSRYTRLLADFPAHGRRLTIKLAARRYMRVSKADGSQMLDLQRDALLAVGIPAARLYEDHTSGKHDERPELEAASRRYAAMTP